MKLAQRQRVELDFSQLTDKDVRDLVSGIKLAATTSPLVLNDGPMQTSVAALVTKDAAFATSSATVTDDKAKLKTDLATEATHRSNLCAELRVYATLIMGGAKVAADVTGAGLSSLTPTPKATLPPEVPAVINTSYPAKGHGKATVSVHETGKSRGQYAAEWSPELITPTSWAPLGVGHGKTRTVTGVSGTKVWVRFATVRGQQQSDWSTPILVTIP